MRRSFSVRIMFKRCSAWLSAEMVLNSFHVRTTGTLLADWDWQERLDRCMGSPWSALLEWEADADAGEGGDAYVVARRIQGNMADSSAARKRIRHSAQDHDAAMAAGGPRNAFDNGESNEFDTDDDVPPPSSTVPDIPSSGIDISADAMLEVPTECGPRNKAYVEDMLGPLSCHEVEAVACRVPCGSEVRPISKDAHRETLDGIAAAQDAAVNFDGEARLQEERAREAAAADTPAMQARLIAMIAGEEPMFAAGDKLPYIRMTVTPSIGDTARLWTLNQKQAIAFALLADVLRKEAKGERVAPERMIITGEAGTGKSRVLQALQWYALQIDAVETMAVLAFTWRAALLLGTPDNPACTTSTFFAIDTFKNGHGGAHDLRLAGKVS